MPPEETGSFPTTSRTLPWGQAERPPSSTLGDFTGCMQWISDPEPHSTWFSSLGTDKGGQLVPVATSHRLNVMERRTGTAPHVQRDVLPQAPPGSLEAQTCYAAPS